MKWITIKAAKNLGKDVNIGTKGEGEIPLYLVGKVAVLPDEALDRTDKDQVVAELERLGIEFDARKAVKELAELLPKE